MRSEIEILHKGKSGEVYAKLLDELNGYNSPHDFIGDAYLMYRDEFPSNPSINGTIFELLVCESLAREGVRPFYYQAKFERVPNADFDIVLYHRAKPVVLSCKTSLRERYKQADLEGAALKQVYRRARSYLLTLEPDEASRVQRKIDEGDVAGLDGCVLADSPEFSELIDGLRNTRFLEGRAVVPIRGTFVPE